MRNGINLLLIGCCATTLFAREEYKRDFKKTLSLPAGRTFRLEHSLGNVTVRTHAGNDASVQATIRCSASNAAEAKRCADAVEIRIDESSSGATVRTIYPHEERQRGFFNNSISFGADYDVVIPQNTPLDLRNRFGNVDVSGVRAGSSINSGNGHITLTSSAGRQTIDSSFAEVEVRQNDGDVIVHNSNGSLIATDITGAADLANRFGTTRVTNIGKALTIVSNNGNIEIRNVGGVATVSNSFGSVRALEVKADLTVRNQNGEVDANDVTGAANLDTTFNRIKFSRVGRAVTVRANNANVTGDTAEAATVETSFGAVDLRDIKGAARVTASNTSIHLVNVGGEAYAKTTFNGVTISGVSGPVTVEGQNSTVSVDPRKGTTCQPISIRTSFGAIRAAIPAGMGYNVTAHTSFGRINSEHEMTVSGQVSPDSFNGKIGGGGCELRLMDQNGSIDILRAP